MTSRRKTKSVRGAAKKLKLKKETIKDLSVRRKAGDVKGGRLDGALQLQCTLGSMVEN